MSSAIRGLSSLQVFIFISKSLITPFGPCLPWAAVRADLACRAAPAAGGPLAAGIETRDPTQGSPMADREAARSVRRAEVGKPGFPLERSLVKAFGASEVFLHYFGGT